MTLERIEQETTTDRLGRSYTHDLIYLKCDTCNKVWHQRGSKTRILSRNTHACSTDCKRQAHKLGGVVYKQFAQTSLERYGAENPYASEQCKEKIRQTMMSRYGVEHALQSQEFSNKQKETMFERYGVEYSVYSPELRMRQIKSMQQNWGVSYPMQLEHVKDALVSGSIAKFGVSYPMQSVEFQKQAFQKRDKNSWMSKPEKKFRILLEEKFGKENVKVQQLIERKWSVDFYVVSIDVWISFDGVYWHGLDRSIDEIKKSSKPRDKAIYEKWLKDRELDEYMIKNHMKLVRITDKEFEQSSSNCLNRLLIEIL